MNLGVCEEEFEVVCSTATNVDIHIRPRVSVQASAGPGVALEIALHFGSEPFSGL